MPDRWTVVFGQAHWEQLRAHLFPGDDDEHGAVISAGVAHSTRGTRLLVRDVFPATDGQDFVPSTRAYRKLRAEFVNDRIRHCRDEKLAYLAVHNHHGHDGVEFSTDDMASHERGYPALLDIVRGQPVGALVMNANALAGDIWTPHRARHRVAETVVLGRNIERFYPAPPSPPRRRGEQDDRQARIYGDVGQELFGKLKVGVIGAGGVGMLIVMLLTRLGVGEIVVVDPERVDLSNLPRLPEATRRDAMALLTHPDRPAALRAVGRRLARRKVDLALRLARRANPSVKVTRVARNVIELAAAGQLTDCDYLFLAADTHQARLVFNAVVHQYLIPGVQVGSKVPVSKATGEIGDVFSIIRPVGPDAGCLWCNAAISSAKLQEEALAPEQLRRQRYVDDEDVPAPSVMTLNAIGAAPAVNDFMFAMTGLLEPSADADAYRRYRARRDELWYDQVQRRADCKHCGRERSIRARGGSVRLPCRG